ncbi:pilus assembly protein TadG-related protein [Streptomyces sp. NPDC001743]|uniref:pilus assembly protein TadG-related protein n=1 Tax=Streptomyces sp. NPDC001743 TaxID=3154397 RepID=UPI00332B2C4E
MIKESRDDRGQAFPIYIVMVAGLLFLAFAFFAVGQASATRNGAQGAADAAALAAAQEARDDLGVPFLAALREPNGLNEFLAHHRYFDAGCWKARRLAFANDSHLHSDDPFRRPLCGWDEGFLRDRVTVSVETDYTVGSSVIPSTKTTHGNATATAVIEFRCSPKLKDAPSADPGSDEGNGKGNDEGGKPDLPIPTLFCDGWPGGLEIDPAHPELWKSVAKAIFAVHLIDD